MATDPLTSAGARLERRATRDHLRRELRARSADPARNSEIALLDDLLKWILKRQSRYEPKPGGLGRK